jgi:hypothetical protein
MTTFHMMDDIDDDDFAIDSEYFQIFDKLAQEARVKRDDDTAAVQDPSQCPSTDNQDKPLVEKVVTLLVDKAGIGQDRENLMEMPNEQVIPKRQSGPTQQKQSYKLPFRKTSSSSCFPSEQQTKIDIDAVNSSSNDSSIVRGEETECCEVEEVPTSRKRSKLSSQELPKEASILAAESSPTTSTTNDNDSGTSSESTSLVSSSSDKSDTSDLSSSSGTLSLVSTGDEVNKARGTKILALRQKESLEASLPSKPNQANQYPKKSVPNSMAKEIPTFADDRSGDDSGNGRSWKGSQKTKESNTKWTIPADTKDYYDSSYDDDNPGSSAAAPPHLRPKVTETPSLEVQDYRPDVDDKETEIDPAYYAPPLYHPRQRPILKEYNIQRHPVHTRRKLQISSLFAHPIDQLWKGRYEEFNPFQSEMAKWICDTDDNVVVSAPTGAGKSTIFEIAMARFITTDLFSQGATVTPHRSHFMSKTRKILYIAPSKALCEERYEDWSRRLQTLGFRIEVAMITGDTTDPGTSFSDLKSAHLIIATPEKWDSMTRRWQENFYLMASVKLLLVDEVHLLGDNTRGWCLETVVTRMKTIQRAAQAVDVTLEELRRSSYAETNPAAIKTPFRMVAVSATLPNIAEVAAFFHANEAYSFDDSYRPIPLTKHIMAMGIRGKNEWKFWSDMVRKNYSKSPVTIVDLRKSCRFLKYGSQSTLRLNMSPKSLNASVKASSRLSFATPKRKLKK